MQIEITDDLIGYSTPRSATACPVASAIMSQLSHDKVCAFCDVKRGIDYETYEVRVFDDDIYFILRNSAGNVCRAANIAHLPNMLQFFVWEFDRLIHGAVTGRDNRTEIEHLNPFKISVDLDFPNDAPVDIMWSAN